MIHNAQSPISDEYDVNLVDSFFVMGGSISQGIPWNAFSELEIQQILKIHFEDTGYKVIWRHVADPANESGIDLECLRESDHSKVIVTVKKKPKKEALAQVLELANELSTKCIYVYIGGSAQSFRDQIKKFTTIDFWDETKLEDALDESGLTLRLKVDNSEANKAILIIMRHILNSIKTKPHTKAPKPTSQTIQTLWDMKDRAVTINKCAGLVQLMFEDPRRLGKFNNKQIQNLVVWCLDYIYAKGLLSLRNAFENLSPELQTLLYKVHKKTTARSNWLELYSYYPGLQPKLVMNAARQREESREEFKKTEKFLDGLEKGEKTPQEEEVKLLFAANEFRCLGIWGDGLEGTIDYLFEKLSTGRIGNP